MSLSESAALSKIFRLKLDPSPSPLPTLAELAFAQLETATVTDASPVSIVTSPPLFLLASLLPVSASISLM